MHSPGHAEQGRRSTTESAKAVERYACFTSHLSGIARFVIRIESTFQLPQIARPLNVISKIQESDLNFAPDSCNNDRVRLIAPRLDHLQIGGDEEVLGDGNVVEHFHTGRVRVDI